MVNYSRNLLAVQQEFTTIIQQEWVCFRRQLCKTIQTNQYTQVSQVVALKGRHILAQGVSPVYIRLL